MHHQHSSLCEYEVGAHSSALYPYVSFPVCMQSTLNMGVNLCVDALGRYVGRPSLISPWNVPVWIKMLMLDQSGSLNDMRRIGTVYLEKKRTRCRSGGKY